MRLTILLAVAAALAAPMARGQAASGRSCCHQGAAAAAAAPAVRSVARVTLGDGSTICGPFQYAAAERVLVVAGKEADDRGTLDYVSLAFVSEVKLVETAADQADSQALPLQQPIEATLTLTTGTQIKGSLQSSSADCVLVLPDGKSDPTIVPVQALARMRLVGAGASQTRQPETLPSPSGVTITLCDGTALSGQMSFDAASQTIALAGVSGEGSRTLDLLSTSLIKDIVPASSEAKPAPPANEPIRLPVRATFERGDGSSITGQWQASPSPDFLALMTEAQVIMLPRQSLRRVHLVESAKQAESLANRASP